MFKIITAFFFSVCLLNVAYAQKWQPGRFTDNKDNTQTGLIRTKPSGKGPVKNEAFIEFKQDEKMNPIKLSASELKSFVAGQDSFVVAHPPGNANWAGQELDFVQVLLNEEVKLYAGHGTRGRKGGVGVHPAMAVGMGGGGGGGYGGMSGGLGVSIGGNGDRSKVSYYYGANTAEMQELTPVSFNDIMSDVMADEPDVVDQIRQNKFNLSNIEGLIAFFKKIKASHQ